MASLVVKEKYDNQPYLFYELTAKMTRAESSLTKQCGMLVSVPAQASRKLDRFFRDKPGLRFCKYRWSKSTNAGI